MDSLQATIVDVIGRERWDRLRADALYPADQALARAAAECAERPALAAVRVYQACGQRPPPDLVAAAALPDERLGDSPAARGQSVEAAPAPRPGRRRVPKQEPPPADAEPQSATWPCCE